MKKELEKITVLNETITVDKQNLQSENKNLSEQVNSLLGKLSDSEQENKIISAVINDKVPSNIDKLF